MELKIFDKKSYQNDSAANLLFSNLNKYFVNRDDCICYYKNPIYFTNEKFYPTFVIVDREYGVIVFKAYNFTDEQLTKVTDNYWVLNGSRVANDFINFDDYCYQLKNDLFQPRY